KLRNALVLVRAQTFSGIARRKRLREQLTLEREPFPLTAFKTGLNRSFDQPNGFAWLIGSDELPRIIQHLFKEIVAFENLVDQSELECFFKSEHAAGSGQFNSSSFADEPGQPLRTAHAGNHAEIHFRKARTAGVLFRDPDIAGHRNLKASADTVTIDRSN